MKAKIYLLPGLDGTGELFRPFLSLAESLFDCVTLPLPTEGSQSYSALTDRIINDLPKEGPTVLLAESFSGPLAVEVIRREPTRFKALVLVASFFSRPRSLLALAPFLPLGVVPWSRPPSAALRWACVGTDASSELVTEVQKVLAMVPPKIIIERMRTLAAIQIQPQKISLPVLYIRPTRDRLVPSSCLSVVREYCEHLTVRNIDGPHFVLQARPGECVQAVVNFLDDVLIAKKS